MVLSKANDAPWLASFLERQRAHWPLPASFKPAQGPGEVNAFGEVAQLSQGLGSTWAWIPLLPWHPCCSFEGLLCKQPWMPSPLESLAEMGI